MGRSVLPPIAAITLLALAPVPALGQTVFGYQLGLTQSVGGTFGDRQDNILTQQQQPGEPGAPPGEEPPGGQIQQLQGIQFITEANANVTFDWSSRILGHGLVLGVAVAQIIPTAVPEDAQAALRERTTTAAATATYLARVQEATWGLALGGGYGFGLNGRLESSANGAVGAQTAGQTLPARRAGAFAFQGITHTFTGNALYQYTKRDWDLAIGGIYTYTQNGVFTLAGGALGAQGQPGPGASSTNVGAFIPANIHTVAPNLVYRTRITRDNLITANLDSTITISDEILDEVTVTGTTTTVVRAPPPPPATIINTARLEYAYSLTQEQIVGVEAVGVLSYRIPTDAQGVPLPKVGLVTDTLITTFRAFYQDLIRSIETRVVLGAGAAQAHLFEAPLGAAVDRSEFDPVRSNWELVFNAALQRRFEPVDVTLQVDRIVGVGALGASAVVTETAQIAFQHIAEFGERRLGTTVGFNANRVRGVGRDLFALPVVPGAQEGAGDPNALLLAAFNNRGFGVNAALAMPLFVEDELTFDAILAYNFNWVDTNPNRVMGLPQEPLLTHVGLLSIRGLWGRGAAQRAVGAGGVASTDELDAFSQNPLTGAPLVTQRLMNQGARFLEQGRRPGEAPEQRRDSRQAFQQRLRQQKVEEEAKKRADLVQSVGTYQDDERRAQERAREEQKKKEGERTREFGEWPMDAVPLPTEP